MFMNRKQKSSCGQLPFLFSISLCDFSGNDNLFHLAEPGVGIRVPTLLHTKPGTRTWALALPHTKLGVGIWVLVLFHTEPRTGIWVPVLLYTEADTWAWEERNKLPAEVASDKREEAPHKLAAGEVLHSHSEDVWPTFEPKQVHSGVGHLKQQALESVFSLSFGFTFNKVIVKK